MSQVLIEFQPQAMTQNTDNFHHHGREQLGMVISSVAFKIQAAVKQIIAALIIAVRVGDEEVQASNNSSWFTSRPSSKVNVGI